MISKSPSGALSPYYYKGGYFHGIHYGSYFDDGDALLSMMGKEETYILKSPEKRRILIDLYETYLSIYIIEKIVEHIKKISPRIVKLAVCSDKKSLRQLHYAVICYEHACYYGSLDHALITSLIERRGYK